MTDKKPSITRQQMQTLFGVSRSKVQEITQSNKIGFPAQKGIAGREFIWDKEEVLNWLKNNDPKTDLRTLSSGRKKNKRPAFDDNLAFDFLSKKVGVISTERNINMIKFTAKKDEMMILIEKLGLKISPSGLSKTTIQIMDETQQKRVGDWNEATCTGCLKIS